ncbi:MAG: hypothetical protein LBK96_00990, partial [Prevotellaceae bacterium]|nr:hypothetical protein [Prevotellaceae bacterium]
MKTLKRYLLFILWTFSFILIARGQSDSLTLETRVLPALYRSDRGSMQKIELKAEYSGTPVSATIRLGDRSQEEKLETGANRFLFE